MWILLALGSAAIIGFYEVLKKHALHNNAVIPVLYFATLTGSAVFLMVNYLHHPAYHLTLSFHGHLLILLKALLVTATWILGFLGLKNLPISIAAPMSAVGPFFTLFGAIFFLNEHLTFFQLAGCIIMIASIFLFSNTAQKEGISIFRSRWVLALLVSALLGAVSSLYDKYLVPRLGPNQVQFWFTFYLPVVMTPFMFVLWYPSRKEDLYIWRWSVPFIGIFLVIADYLYFHAIVEKDALIAVIDALRRSNLVIAFLLGGMLFGEMNIRKKGVAICGVLTGVILIIIS
jgi:bacterial/archaeal transporter family protein